MLTLVRERSSLFDKLYELGIDMIDSRFFENGSEIEAMLFEQAFGEEGGGWITWYLYEKPDGEEGGKVICEDGEEWIINSDDKLYEFMEKFYGEKKHA